MTVAEPRDDRPGPHGAARPNASVERTAAARIPTRAGDFVAHVYRNVADGAEHVALVKGQVRGRTDVLVRMHSECLTGDVFGSLRCDCGEQLELALTQIATDGRGVVVYLRGHEGRGIGLGHKLQAYALQDQGRDTVEANLELGFPADSRDYGIGAAILADLGVGGVRLMTNNLHKSDSLEDHGIRIVDRVPLLPPPNDQNVAYLRAKQRKLGHLLHIDGDEVEPLRP